MRKILLLFMLLSSLSCFAQLDNTYPLNVEKSIINWKGSYSFLFSEHKGIVNFTKGELITTSYGNIIGGHFEVDMTSITHPEEGDGYGPIEHLKNEDFFDVERYPLAHIVIREVTFYEDSNKHKIKADLTIKEITNSVEFWSEVDTDAKLMKAKLLIDRTRWGIIYNHKIKNKAISDAIELDVSMQF